MRLALALAALVVASPAGALADEADDVNKLLQLVAAVQYVQANCSGYRSDLFSVGKLLDANKLKPKDLETVYKNRFAEISAAMTERAKGRESQMCDYIFDAYNDQLPTYHLFVKK